MNPPPTHDDAADGPPGKKPQIGRREIGALLLNAWRVFPQSTSRRAALAPL